MFSDALEDVLSALAQPRYVVPRLVVEPPRGLAGGIALAGRRMLTGGVPAAVVYYAVPAVLGARKNLAATFGTAWNARVSPGAMLCTASREGAGVLAAQRVMTRSRLLRRSGLFGDRRAERSRHPARQCSRRGGTRQALAFGDPPGFGGLTEPARRWAAPIR